MPGTQVMDVKDPRMLAHDFANFYPVFTSKLPVHQIVQRCYGNPPGTHSHIQDNGDGKERICIGNYARRREK